MIRATRRIEPINRSTYPFCQGEWYDVGRSRIPIARTRALNAAPNARSLSRMRYFGALSQGNASVIWRASLWLPRTQIRAYRWCYHRAIRPGPGDGLAVDKHMPAMRPDESRNHLEKWRLPAAAPAQKTDEFSLINSQIQSSKNN